MTMYQDYFELLDIDRNLPAWAYVKKLHDARMRFEREYNGELPDQVKSAITVLIQKAHWENSSVEDIKIYQNLLKLIDEI